MCNQRYGMACRLGLTIAAKRVYSSLGKGPLAQLAERLVDVEEVTGSSPVQPMRRKKTDLAVGFFVA